MRFKRNSKILLSMIGLAGILYLGGKAIAQPYRISGDCMEPAIRDKQLCFLNRATPRLRPYRLGDVILFNHEGHVWISRIVALETNTIQITEKNITLNGIPLPNQEIARNWAGWANGTYGINRPFQVPIGHVFVLSDNLSANHDDSRVFGPISTTSILGLIW